jgi:hypothetical protein
MPENWLLHFIASPQNSPISTTEAAAPLAKNDRKASSIDYFLCYTPGRKASLCQLFFVLHPPDASPLKRGSIPLLSLKCVWCQN